MRYFEINVETWWENRKIFATRRKSHTIWYENWPNVRTKEHFDFSVGSIVKRLMTGPVFIASFLPKNIRINLVNIGNSTFKQCSLRTARLFRVKFETNCR